MPEWDVVVIGGGAAGRFCAFEAGWRGRKVLLLEHNDRIGKKISISGGGRCNFTNIYATSENYVSANPHFSKSALARYTPADFISLVEKHSIAYHEKKLGQLFCDVSSEQIINMLLKECHDAGVEVRCRCQVQEVRKEKDSFKLATNQGAFSANSLVIATGGLSIAPLGATDFGYRIARQFGLRIEEPRPALVPLTFDGAGWAPFAELAGLSLPVVIETSGPSTGSGRTASVAFHEDLLFTHRGLSGPAVLQ